MLFTRNVDIPETEQYIESRKENEVEYELREEYAFIPWKQEKKNPEVLIKSDTTGGWKEFMLLTAGKC
jgi:hypothetical protein